MGIQRRTVGAGESHARPDPLQQSALSSIRSPGIPVSFDTCKTQRPSPQNRRLIDPDRPACNGSTFWPSRERFSRPERPRASERVQPPAGSVTVWMGHSEDFRPGCCVSFETRMQPSQASPLNPTPSGRASYHCIHRVSWRLLVIVFARPWASD